MFHATLLTGALDLTARTSPTLTAASAARVLATTLTADSTPVDLSVSACVASAVLAEESSAAGIRLHLGRFGREYLLADEADFVGGSLAFGSPYRVEQVSARLIVTRAMIIVTDVRQHGNQAKVAFDVTSRLPPRLQKCVLSQEGRDFSALLQRRHLLWRLEGIVQ